MSLLNLHKRWSGMLSNVSLTRWDDYRFNTKVDHRWIIFGCYGSMISDALLGIASVMTSNVRIPKLGYNKCLKQVFKFNFIRNSPKPAASFVIFATLKSIIAWYHHLASLAQAVQFGFLWKLETHYLKNEVEEKKTHQIKYQQFLVIGSSYFVLSRVQLVSFCRSKNEKHYSV